MDPILVGRSTTTAAGAPVVLQPRYGNRHGLVAGATGTGKTVTLMTLAEGFSRIGVPVFIADVKGDVAGLAMPGEDTAKLRERVAAIGIDDYRPGGCPTIFWDLYGRLGHPVRTTVSEMGPLLLSRILELNDTQAGVLDIVFKLADDRGLLLLDLAALAAGFGFLVIGLLPWPWLKQWWATHHIHACAVIANRVLFSREHGLRVATLSIAIHVVTVVIAWCVVKSITAPVTFGEIFQLLPPVMLITMMPISIAGWGVREATMALAFGYAGLVANEGVNISLLFGAVFLSQLPAYTKLILGGDESVVTLLLTVFSLGIGAGSLLCERLSGRQVEIGLVPLGSIGLTLFGIDLYFAYPEAAQVAGLTASAFLQQPEGWRVVIDLALIGMFGGFYIVPLYALIQTRSEPTHRSRIIAGNNILNALFMVVAAVLAILLLKAGLNIPELLLVVALMNAAVAVFIYSLVPEFLMRFLVWMLTRLLYRIEQRGMENIPEQGAAVIVCNHVSFVDALILGGNIRRPVRFVMYHKIFRIPVLNFIFRTARAIPIAPAKEDEALMKRAFEEIAAALQAGELVGIFPEGGLTPDGEIQEFRSGIERIVARTPVPVVLITYATSEAAIRSALEQVSADGHIAEPPQVIRIERE